MSTYSPTTQELSSPLDTDLAPSLYLVPIILAVGVLWVVELLDEAKSRLAWRPKRKQHHDQDKG